MREDETGTHRILREYLDAITAIIEQHNGRIVNYAGDAIMSDFATVTDALTAAIEFQADIRHRNQQLNLPDEKLVRFRVGVHLGEIIVDGTAIYGDGVNVAARLEGLADPGGVCISEAVRSAVGTRLTYRYDFMGERTVKNIKEAFRVYRVVAGDDITDLPPPCPYPGMRPFQTTDARHFYGRDEEVGRMIQLLRRQQFFMVIGPSGSGKSSLIYAGLLPELADSRYFTKNYWLVRTMRPGEKPFEDLCSLVESTDADHCFDKNTVQSLLDAHAPAKRLLLLVDQFEEVFTLSEPEQRTRFLTALEAASIPDNCALILTLRADFYPDLMTSPLWPIDPAQRIEVAPLRGDELSAAIENPAKDCGVHIETSLLNQLLTDAADEPGVLPLLQETMGQLWVDMDHRVLTHDAYRRLSDGATNQADQTVTGLAVAIATKADSALAELSTDEITIARRIFLRLIHFGEGRADTRRQQPVSALRAASDDEQEFERTLEHLTNHRLLTRSVGVTNHDALVDISHESLIAGWSRLRDWIDERRDSEQSRRRLEDKAAEWVRLGRGTGGLLDETELPEAQRWLASPDAEDLGFNASVPSLIDESQAALSRAAQAQEDARRLELQQAEALSAEQRQRLLEQGRATARMRRAMAGLLSVFLVAVGAAAFAWIQTQKAEENAQEAEKGRDDAEKARFSSIAQLALIQAQQQQAFNLDERSVLLARQGYLYSEHGSRTLQEQVDSVLRQVNSKAFFSVQLLNTGSVYSLALSPDGSQLATSHIISGEVLLWDLTTRGSEPQLLPGWPTNELTEDGLPIGAVFSKVFSPDGRYLIAGNEDGALYQWDLNKKDASPVDLGQLNAGIATLAYSPDGQYLALGNRLGNTAVLWQHNQPVTEGTTLATSEQQDPDNVPQLNQGGGIPVAFTPDSNTLITGSFDGVITLWDPAEPAIALRSWPGHESAILSLAVSPDGTKLASGDADGLVRIWDLTSETPASIVWNRVDAPILSVHFSPDGHTLAGSGNWGIGLWDLQQPTKDITVIKGFINQVQFGPDGDTLVSAGLDGGYSLQLWDLTPSGKPITLKSEQDTTSSLAFSPDGKQLATGGGSGDRNIRLWDLDSLNTPPKIMRGHAGWISSVEFSPDGNELVSASDDSTVRVWSLGNTPDDTPAEKHQLSLMFPWSARYSPDGRRLASGSVGGTYLWDTDNLAQETAVFSNAKGWMSEIAFSPDGNTIAASGDGDATIRIQNINDAAAPMTELNGHEVFAWSLDFSPDGQLLASGGKDAKVRLWDLNTSTVTPDIIGRHDDEVLKVRFNPAGNVLATTSLDRSVRLWNLNNPKATPTILQGHEDEIWAMAFSPDGNTLATGSTHIKLWDMTHPLIKSAPSELAEQVCQKVWRNLTIDEWYRFIGEDIPYERTCPNLPVHSSLMSLAASLATSGDTDAAVALLTRATELDTTLTFDPVAEAERLAELPD